MVKNYLVCAVRPIKEGWMNKSSSNLHHSYLELYKLSLASFKKFVIEPFEHILWTNPADNNFDYNSSNWNDIKSLWNDKQCNIFWAGADTIMIKPTSLYSNVFKEYRIFNYTDPKSHSNFPHYFNDDIQYFPHTMDKSVWDLGDNLMKQGETHPEKQWGFDQMRHNYMFWSQNIDITSRCHPAMAYQAQNMRNLNPDVIEWHNKWNGLDINNANILHFHASRGTQDVYTLMKEITLKLGI